MQIYNSTATHTKLGLASLAILQNENNITFNLCINLAPQTKLMLSLDVQIMPQILTMICQLSHFQTTCSFHQTHPPLIYRPNLRIRSTSGLSLLTIPLVWRALMIQTWTLRPQCGFAILGTKCYDPCLPKTFSSHRHSPQLAPPIICSSTQSVNAQC
jgi:hypothetical protein